MSTKRSYVRTLKAELARINDRIDRAIVERKPFAKLAADHLRIRSLLVKQA